MIQFDSRQRVEAIALRHANIEQYEGGLMLSY